MSLNSTVYQVLDSYTPCLAGPSGFPALLAKPGGCGTRALALFPDAGLGVNVLWRWSVLRARTVLADCPRPRCATRRLRRGGRDGYLAVR